MKKSWAALAVFAVIFSAFGSPAFGAGWSAPGNETIPQGASQFVINEPTAFAAWNSWNSEEKARVSKPRFNKYLCPNGPDKSHCDPKLFDITTVSLIGRCNSELSENCIEGLNFYGNSGLKTPATFEREVDGTKYKGRPEIDLIPGEAVSLWRADGFNHAGGENTYAAIVKIEQHFDSAKGKFNIHSFAASIVPYVTGSGGQPASHEEWVDSQGYTSVGTNMEGKCSWIDSLGCGIHQDFGDNVRVELSVRISNKINGWFKGRIQHPDASISKFSNMNDTLVISGEPVSIPRFATYFTKENTPAEAEAWLPKSGSKNIDDGLFTGQYTYGYFADDSRNAMPMLEFLRVASKDTAAGFSRVWNFSTLNSYSSNSCLSDKSMVLGIVTTNATVYDGEVPNFANGQLSYQVSGLHYGPDGKTLNEGSYDLVMRSAVARCLYGFTKAPVSATISVLGEGGEKKVATTVVSEKDGWLKLAAYGFTYSSPRISVKLSQGKAASKVQPMKTITCVNGKIVKRITLPVPKCPAGYKKR